MFSWPHYFFLLMCSSSCSQRHFFSPLGSSHPKHLIVKVIAPPPPPQPDPMTGWYMTMWIYRFVGTHPHGTFLFIICALLLHKHICRYQWSAFAGHLLGESPACKFWRVTIGGPQDGHFELVSQGTSLSYHPSPLPFFVFGMKLKPSCYSSFE